jgi:hypothetical protein
MVPLDSLTTIMPSAVGAEIKTDVVEVVPCIADAPEPDDAGNGRRSCFSSKSLTYSFVDATGTDSTGRPARLIHVESFYNV